MSLKPVRSLLAASGLLFMACLQFIRGAIPASERTALIALYGATSGDSWTNNSGWKTPPLDVDGFALPGTEGSWFGVTMASDQVSEINLSGNNLAGFIPAEIGNLTGLWMLLLHENQLGGPIPAEVGNLTNLQYFYLYSNHLTGSIPSEIGHLVDLKSLSLYSNQLTGIIPAEIGDLTGLEKLLLFDNQLTGSIPAEIGNLTGLITLSLYSNQLTGSIPAVIGSLTGLERLYLDFNNFSGAFPEWIGNLTRLQRLRLGDNQLTGAIPPLIGSLTSLTDLVLDSNQLTGSIPPEIGNLTGLQRLKLNDNQLSGTIPAEIGNLTGLTELDLSGNHLAGTAPAEFGNLTRLQTLFLYSNQLSGAIPAGIGSLSHLTSLLLYENSFTGSIPAGIGNLSGLEYLYLYTNQLTGEVPAEIGNLTNLRSLILYGNELSGSIPAEIGSLTGLSLLSLADNRISGRIPVEIGNLTGLERLFLESNRLSGPIPVEMVNLSLLSSLNLGYNCLTAVDPGLLAFLDEKDPAWSSTQCLSSPPITVTSPNGGESWAGGSARTITWMTAGTVPGVKIEYSLDNGANWATIVGSTPNGEGYAWTVPYAVSANCLVRVSDAADTAVNDVSDGAFAIDVSDPLTLLSPAGGEAWTIGSVHPISWFSKASGGRIDIFLYKGTSNLGAIATGVPEGDGVYSWRAGYLKSGIKVAVGSTYRVSIVSRSDKKIKAISPAYFRLVKPKIFVTAPLSGTTWGSGSSQRISWTSAAVEGTVDILLYRYGVPKGRVASGVPVSDLGFSWTVGALDTGSTTPAGPGYSIWVRASAGATTGKSPGTFSIRR